MNTNSVTHHNRRLGALICFELWLDLNGYEIFICGLLQGRHAVKKALIWQAKQTLMRPDNQWQHWWQCVVALGSEQLDGLTVNNEWGDSWLISKVVSPLDTQLAFQWGLQHQRHANNSPIQTVLHYWSIPASQQDGGQDVNQCRPLMMWKKVLSCEWVETHVLHIKE